MDIKNLNKKIKRECKKYPLCKTPKVVPGEGNSKAKIMLIGQNPGEEEDKQGKPFVGKSGKYLNKILNENKINRKKIYITNVVKCKTPKNRKPTKKEIEFFMPFLIEQIKTIKPKIIILLGEVAWQVPKQASQIKGINAIYIKTYHPAAAMRFSKIRQKFKTDFKKIAVLIKRKI